MLTAELNKTRRIGAEFEMTVPLIGRGDGHDVQETLATILTANGICSISRGYSHDPLPPRVDLAVEYDASVRGESKYDGIKWFPVEIKTRILNGVADWENVVPKMLEISRYMGARVNASTGHHLHLGFDELRDNPRVIRSFWNLAHRFNDVVFGLVSPSRRQNNYCRSMPPASKILHGANSIRTIKRVLGPYDRYCAFNTMHLFGDGPRVEMRHHQGTLNPQTARMWLRFCLQFMQHAVNRNCQAAESMLPNDRKSLDKLLVTIGLKVNSKVYAKVSPELRECGRYMLRRWKHFNAPPPPSSHSSHKASFLTEVA